MLCAAKTQLIVDAAGATCCFRSFHPLMTMPLCNLDRSEGDAHRQLLPAASLAGDDDCNALAHFCIGARGSHP